MRYKKEKTLFISGSVGTVIIILFLLSYGYSFITAKSYAGETYDVTVTVQAVEHSTRFGDHTNLWIQVYGDQDVMYTLIGDHVFEIGKTYRIKFTDRMVWNWYNGFEAWGEIQSIERLTS